MTDAQLEVMKIEIKKAVDNAVETKVNGKITALDKKIDEHMTKMQPYMEALSGMQLIYKLFMAMGSIAIAWVAIRGIFGR